MVIEFFQGVFQELFKWWRTQYTTTVVCPSTSDVTLQNMGDLTNLSIHQKTQQSVNSTSGITPCMRSANERRRCIATSSLIGWAQTRNDVGTSDDKLTCTVYRGTGPCKSCTDHFSGVTRALMRLKTPAIQLFVQFLFRLTIKIQTPYPPVAGEFPSISTRNAESVSMPRPHHKKQPFQELVDFRTRVYLNSGLQIWPSEACWGNRFAHLH